MAQDTTLQKRITIEEYEKEMDEIIVEMLQVIIRVQRKIDDEAYRKTLIKLQAL